jgi:transcriptional/translational regulatory protein YebC/TACO1
MFSKQGIISYGPGADEDGIIDVAVEAGAEDVVTNDDGSIDVMTTPEEFSEVKTVLVDAGHTPDSAEVTFHAATRAEMDQDTAEKLLKMVDTLEDLDDVQEVYTNADISDEIMDALGE